MRLTKNQARKLGIDTSPTKPLGDQVLYIDPVAAPRMTKRDKWAKRPCVVKYFDFRDKVRLARAHVRDSGDTISFILPMPKSWSKKKREQMKGAPHQQKPDVDNLLKALLDSIFEDDCHIYDVRPQKFWGESGCIKITRKA